MVRWLAWRFSGLGVVVLASVVFSLAAGQARAVENYRPNDFSLLTSHDAEELVETVGLGLDHQAFASATPLGPGFEVAVDLRAVALSPDFKSAIVETCGVPADGVPSLVPLPGLQLRKGLPHGVDLGFSFSQLEGGGSRLYRAIGGDLQWAFRRESGEGGRGFSAALRLSYAAEQLFFIKSRQFALDLVASKRFLLMDPYVGAGLETWSGSLVVPDGVPTGTADLHSAGLAPRVFAGVPLRIFFLKFTAQVDYSLAEVLTYGAKIGFAL